MQLVYKESNGIQGEQGIQGETGATGNGISTIVKTSTNGLVDTYTITYTNGNTTTFNVTNGKGISSIVKTGSAGLVDVYRVTFNDGTYFDYTVTNGQNGEVTAEELQDVYEQMSSELEDSTATGTEIDTTGGAYWKAEIELNGNTGQDTNIITYTCDGTETGDYYFVDNNTNYQFTMPTVSSGDVIYFNTDTLKLYLSTTEITTTTASTGTLITMQNTPNPNYEQPIKVVKGENTIIAKNKNLFDGVWELGFINGSTGNNASNNNLMRCKNFVPVKELTEYKFSSLNPNLTELFIYEYREDLSYNLTINKSLSFTNTLITDAKTKYIRFRTNSSSFGTPDLEAKLQIEEGTTATDYIPHQEQTYPITLPEGMELCKIGDYQDYIYKSGDNWYKHSEIGKFILDGTENWTNQGGTQDTSTKMMFSFQKLQNDKISNRKGYCNRFINCPTSVQSPNVDVEAFNFNPIYNYSGFIYIKILKSRLNEESINGFKIWLASNNLIVYYQLAESIDTQITDTTLVQQLNDLYDKLKTYQGVTHITQSNAEIPFILKLNYKKSNILRIQALEQAILSQGANV